MTTDNTIRREAIEMLLPWIPSITPFRNRPAHAEAAIEILKEFLASPRTVVFEFAGRQCLVNGVPIVSSSKGLPLAWVVLAMRQRRLGSIELEWIFSGKSAHRSLRNTILRAADDAERYSLALAAAIRAIGAENGLIVMKGEPRGIVCTSPQLVAACA